MANRLVIGAGKEVTIAADQVRDVFGKANSNETVNVSAGVTATFGADFNANEDTIVLPGNASNYEASVSGATATITDNNGTTVHVPAGTAATTIEFDDGSADLVVNQSDEVQLGNQVLSASGAAVDIPSIDTIAGGDGINASEADAVEISGSSAEANATVDVTVSDGDTDVTGQATADDSGDWTVSGLDVTGLTEGDVTVSATQTDAAGNTSSEKTATVAYDATVVAPSIDTIAGGDGINASEADAVEISGSSAEANATVDVTVSDGDTDVTGQATADDSGDWTVSGLDVTGLTEGDVTVSATQTDAAGNTSSEKTETVTYDATAPSVSNLGYDGTKVTFHTDEGGTASINGTSNTGGIDVSPPSDTLTLVAEASVVEGALDVTDAVGNTGSSAGVAGLGTNQSDTNIASIDGSSYGDVLLGFDGNDVLTGGNGPDVLAGFGGADTLDLSDTDGAEDRAVLRPHGGDGTAEVVGFKAGRGASTFSDFFTDSRDFEIVDAPVGSGPGSDDFDPYTSEPNGTVFLNTDSVVSLVGTDLSTASGLKSALNEGQYTELTFSEDGGSYYALTATALDAQTYNVFKVIDSASDNNNKTTVNDVEFVEQVYVDSFGGLSADFRDNRDSGDLLDLPGAGPSATVDASDGSGPGSDDFDPYTSSPEEMVSLNTDSVVGLVGSNLSTASGLKNSLNDTDSDYKEFIFAEDGGSYYALTASALDAQTYKVFKVIESAGDSNNTNTVNDVELVGTVKGTHFGALIADNLA